MGGAHTHFVLSRSNAGSGVGPHRSPLLATTACDGHPGLGGTHSAPAWLKGHKSLTLQDSWQSGPGEDPLRAPGIRRLPFRPALVSVVCVLCKLSSWSQHSCCCPLTCSSTLFPKVCLSENLCQNSPLPKTVPSPETTTYCRRKAHLGFQAKQASLSP